MARVKVRKIIDVPNPWPRKRINFEVHLIPKYLEKLAREGVYYDSKIISQL